MIRSSARRDRGFLHLFAVVAAVASIHGCRDANEATPQPPPAVTVAKPVTESVANYLDFTGNTAATQKVTVVARVEGYLEKIHFTDGQQEEGRSPVHHPAGAVPGAAQEGAGAGGG